MSIIIIGDTLYTINTDRRPQHNNITFIAQFLKQN